MTEDRNCISWWHPRLVEAGVRTPKTELVRYDADDIGCMFDGGKPKDWDEFLRKMAAAAERVGLPCFLRSGHFSGKHEWDRCCYVEKVEDIGRMVYATMELGECMNFFGFPWGVWALREFLPADPTDVAFLCKQRKNMLVRREFRAFVRDGKLECMHPYWPEDAFSQVDGEQRVRLADISQPSDEEMPVLRALAERAGSKLPGYWSVDLLVAADGEWYVTDCAMGENSYHWNGCDKVPAEIEA